MTFLNISVSGAFLTITREISPELRAELKSFVVASKKGMAVPIQLVVNNVKVPITLLNISDENTFGLRICRQEKYADFAEKGETLFKTLVELAQSKGAPEAPFVDHVFLTRDFLPPEIRQFIESDEYKTLSVTALANSLSTAIPALKELEGDVKELTNVATLYGMLLETKKRDLALIIGSEMYFIAKESNVILARTRALLASAVNRLCANGKIFPEESDKTNFEKILATRAARKPPEKLAELSPKHPIAVLMNARLESFNKASTFVLALAPHLGDYFFNTYLPRDSAIVKYFGDSKQTVKNTLHRWIQNFLMGIYSSKDLNKLNEIYDGFKQTMYEYMQAKKVSDVLAADINNILEGNIKEGEKDVRARFFDFMCKYVEEEVNARFREYKHDQETK